MREAFKRLEQSLDAMVHLSPGQQAAQDLLDGDERHVCLVGGTRSGKTFLITRKILQRASQHPGSLHAILRFRTNAARASISNGTLPTVARRCFPSIVMEERRQDGFWALPNGSQIWVGGLDDKQRVEKILGNEFATLFLNECSQIPYASVLVALTRLAQMVPGLTQRAYFDLNPVEKTHWTNRLFGEKRDPITKLQVVNPDAYARAFLNPMDNKANLSAEYIESLKAMPARARKRFFEGQYVEELEGALWTSEMIERSRVSRADVPEFKRVVVAVDPATTNNESSDETGIVVGALGIDDKVYVLADATMKGTPSEWAARAVSLYHAYQADRIVAEVNQGGLMVENTIRMVDPNTSYKGVHASRGKIARAEPVSALYEAGRVLHVGDGFPELEEQLTSYTQGAPSPDRFDALVWCVSELMLGYAGQRIPIVAPVSFSRPHFWPGDAPSTRPGGEPISQQEQTL